MNRFAMFAVVGLSVCLSASNASADPVGGPVVRKSVVSALAVSSWNVVFRGGELARIRVCGDGDTDLDIAVYDEYGRLVACDTARGDRCSVVFLPRYTGRFTVKVINLGRVANEYVIGAD